MPTDKLRIESNERIDIQDFEFLAHEGIHDNIEQIMESLVCAPTRTKKWVLSGFAMTNPAATNLQVTKGRAILAERRDGVVRYGMLVTEGDATKTIDMNTYAAGDYGIFVRFEPVAGESSSRIFWNPAGAGSEYASSINTRYQANWSLRVEATTPGAEWMRIGTVAQATMTITDEREFYFEGKVDDSYESGWSTDGGGIANDRNADRASYGVTDFQMFTAAMRQCLTDIRGRGLREWYERDIGGMNIGFDADPYEDTLAVGDANFFLALPGSNPKLSWAANDYLEYTRSSNQLELVIASASHYFWTTDEFRPSGTRGLGTSTYRWDTIYGKTVNADRTVVSVGASGYDAFDGTGGADVGAGPGGYGAVLIGGNSSSGLAGYGVQATGASGSSASATPGYGGKFIGAAAYAASALAGASGIYTTGGNGDGVGVGGIGIEGIGGIGGIGAGGYGGKFTGGGSSVNGGAGIWGIGYDTGAGTGGTGVIGDGANAASALGAPGIGAEITGGTVSNASNTNHGAIGLDVIGGASSAGGGFGGDGVYAEGGFGDSALGGYGVIAVGGNSGGGTGGRGVSAVGGNSAGTYSGGYGVYGVGGVSNSSTASGGVGVYGLGGGNTNTAGTLGAGVRGEGGDGSSNDKSGGAGGLFYGGDGIGTGISRMGVFGQGGAGGAADGDGGQFVGGGTTGVGVRATGGSSAAAIRIISLGGDPSPLVNGDIWYTGTALKCQVNDTTYTLAP